MSNMRRLLLATLCIAVALATAAPAAAGTDRHGGQTVVPPQSRIFGNTYGQWNAKWWQWLFQTPFHDSPVLSGPAGDSASYAPVDCSAGQRGPVWFLGGTFLPTTKGPSSAASDVYRTCSVPAGTYLFLPLLNSEADNLFCPNTTYSAADLTGFAKGNIDSIVPGSLSATIDGDVVTGVDDAHSAYRSPSPWFSYRMPGDNVGQLPEICRASFPAGSSPPRVDRHAGATADGIYVMVSPLSPGKHRIHVGGTARFPGEKPGETFDFVQNVNYKITVTQRCWKGNSSQGSGSGCGHH
jgi:hypothetical protein